MAQVRGIEDLSQDELSEIMIRVAKQPNGALDFTRASLVSKKFLNFTEDRDVLLAVSFSDMPPLVAQQYDRLMEVEGLVVRCAKARNSSAQFALGKVVLVSASKMCNAYIGGGDFGIMSNGNDDINILHKAARLLNHFSAPNKNPTESIELVRNFVSQATGRDFNEMFVHLRNFIALCLDGENKPLLDQFFTAVHRLSRHNSTPLALSSDPYAYLVRHFNMLCNMAYNMMKGMEIDEGAIQSFVVCSVKRDDKDVDCQTLLERLDIIDPILKLGGLKAINRGSSELLLTSGGVLFLSSSLREQMVQLMEHEAFVKSSRTLMLSSFDGLFDIKQGSL